MIGVVASIENARAENQWDYLLANFEPDKFWIIHPDHLVPSCNLAKRAQRIYSCAELPSEVSLVLLQAKNGKYLQGDTPLNHFAHPENAIYFFGSNNEQLYLPEQVKDPTPPNGSYFEGRKPNYKVYIPIDSNHEMYSWIAGGITFWDRRMKQWPAK